MSSMLTSRSLTPKEGLMRDDSDSPRAMATSMTHSMTNSFFSAFVSRFMSINSFFSAFASRFVNDTIVCILEFCSRKKTHVINGDVTRPTLQGDDTMDKSFVLTPNGGRANLYESLRHTGAATLLENLQSQVKQQDGEIVQLQVCAWRDRSGADVHGETVQLQV